MKSQNPLCAAFFNMGAAWKLSRGWVTGEGWEKVKQTICYNIKAKLAKRAA